jgi:putative membrane protein
VTPLPPGKLRLPAALLAGVLALLAWSAIAPHDWPTWLLEAAPVLIAVPVLVATARRFPLTPLAYVLIALHAALLIVGAHYTYARVPCGAWVQEALGLERNPFDRLGHLMQGFVPAILAREILLRRSPLLPGRWLSFVVLCVALAISALYELLEWWTALAAGAAAESFLGTQGDPWDTQWDMFLALVGAIVALATLTRLHDRQLVRIWVDVARGVGWEP